MSATATTETDARDLKISEQANVIVELTKVIEQLKKQNKELEEKVQRLEALLAARLDAKSSNSDQQVDIVEHAGGNWSMGGYRQVIIRT